MGRPHPQDVSSQQVYFRCPSESISLGGALSDLVETLICETVKTMVLLTVGYVAGFIAAAIFVGKFVSIPSNYDRADWL